MSLTVEETTDLYHDGEDYAADLRSATGERCVLQRVIFFWTTPKGFFKWPGWENRGCDAHEWLLDKPPLWRVKFLLEEEAKQDEQVDECVVAPSFADDGKQLLIDGLITTVFGVSQFSMTITEATAKLLSLQAAA